WLSVPDPRPPYMVSEPYASMYDHIALPMPIWREGEMDNKPYRQRAAVEWGALHQAYPTEADLMKLKRIYYGMISCIDTELGKLLALLKEKRLEENTIILFTSDHGDYLGDHHMIRKGPHLYDALTRVPLIIKWQDVI